MQNYKQLTDDFKKLAQSDLLSHAYLFFGENIEAQFLFARSLANFLENKVFKEPSRLLQETLIISPNEKGTIGIDLIRSLKYFLWQKPVNSSRRVAIVKEAQNLTFEAQNTALKIVEEPPESALIVFIAKSEEDLLPALNSRLQKIYFPQNADSRGSMRIVDADSRGKDLNKFLMDNIANEAEIDQFFENLICDFKKDPIKNSQQLKEILKRLTLIKQFNTNKRLQIRALMSAMENG